MSWKQILTPLIALSLSASAGATNTEPTTSGKLLIVGGALSDETEGVHRAFLDALPSDTSAIAIVPLASSSPYKSPAKFKQALIRYGANGDQIRILPLAVTDDRSTPFDERQWAGNAQDQALADSLRDVGGFWFVGGDQMRIINALLPQQGQPSKVLKAIQQQLQRGAVIGGTSAGAAMMSQPMIASGDSFNALTQPAAKHYSGTESQEQGNLYLHHGLGFFPYGIIDQHFDRKARLGRLVRTLSETHTDRGFGIDEDTGILVNLSSHQFQVVGSGNVTVLDSQQASFRSQPFAAHNIELSLLSNGDRFDLAAHQLLSPRGQITVGKEYASEMPHQGSGLSLANGRLNQLLGYQLLDNAASREIRRYNFIEGGKGFLYRFRQEGSSQAYWTAADGSVDRYTISSVRFDIEPVTISITPAPSVHAQHGSQPGSQNDTQDNMQE